MTWLGLGLLLLSSAGWSAFDLLRKKLSHKVSTWCLVWLLHIGQAPLYVVWFVFEGNPLHIPLEYLPYGVGIMAISLLSNACFLKAIQQGDLSKTVPLLALSPVFTILNGIWLLGEYPNLVQSGGIALIVLGCFSLQIEIEDLKQMRLRQVIAKVVGGNSAFLMASTAYLWSLGTVVDKVALQFVDESVHAIFEALGVGALLTFIFARRKHVQPLMANFPLMQLWIGSVVIAALAFGLQLLAIQEMPVAIFDAGKRSLGTLMSLLSGFYLLGEKVNFFRWLSAGILVFGILIISLS